MNADLSSSAAVPTPGAPETPSTPETTSTPESPETPDTPPPTPGPDEPTAAAVEALVAERSQWLPLPDVAERLNVSVTAVRRLVEDRELLGQRVGERRILSVPAAFIGEGELAHHLKGTFVVLTDGGMNDVEVLHWLFTPDLSLPVAGAPIDALLAGHKTEVRRRAMETAW